MKNSEIYKRLYNDYSKKYLNKILISVFFGVMLMQAPQQLLGF